MVNKSNSDGLGNSVETGRETHFLDQGKASYPEDEVSMRRRDNLGFCDTHLNVSIVAGPFCLGAGEPTAAS
jgi:hypothetical protein